jgi:hypothetical protein
VGPVSPTVQTESAPRRTRTYNPLTKSQLNDSATSHSGGTSGDATAIPNSNPNSCDQGLLDADARLVLIVNAWDALPEAVRAGIAATVAAVRE